MAEQLDLVGGRSAMAEAVRRFTANAKAERSAWKTAPNHLNRARDGMPTIEAPVASNRQSLWDSEFTVNAP